MKTRLLTVIAAAVLSCSAQAALITEHYTSTITGFTNTTGLTVGDTFTWSVTFDNAGVRMTDDYDGPDGIANTADDYLLSDYCLNGFADGCTINNGVYATGGWTMFSDAVFALQLPTYGVAFAQTGLSNVYSYNRSRANDNSDGRTARELNYDNFRFFMARTSQGAFYDFRVGGIAQVDFTSQLTRVTSADVPAPLTLTLLGLGLAGLGWSRRNRS